MSKHHMEKLTCPSCHHDGDLETKQSNTSHCPNYGYKYNRVTNRNDAERTEEDKDQKRRCKDGKSNENEHFVDDSFSNYNSDVRQSCKVYVPKIGFVCTR